MDSETEVSEALLFANGLLAMEAYMRGGFNSDFFPPHNHAQDVRSQYQLVLNWTREACLWLNQQTDELSDDDACRFVRQKLEKYLQQFVIETRKTAFGTTETIYSAMKVVAVTCYPARRGGYSSNVNNPETQVATRRFVVHYDGF